MNAAAARSPWFTRGWLLYLGAGLLFGTYLGLNQLINLLDNPRFGAWEPLLWETSSVVVIFALIPAIAALERRVPVDGRPRMRVVLVHLAGVLAFSAVHVALMVAIRKGVYLALMRHYDFGSVPLRGLYELQKDLVTYAVVLTVCFAYRQFKVRREGELRSAGLATELAEARLRHLTAQIEPHFLFNTLNAISNRMHEDVEAADRMVSQLGALRAAYDTRGGLTVPLASELSWLEDYAAMMTERFRGKLTVNIDVDPGLEAFPVPRLLLQPLLENALRHGLPDGRGRVDIRVTRQDTLLCYEVRDDGAGLGAAPRTGTGLANVEHRIALLYPDAGRVDLAANTPRGTCVRVRFPGRPVTHGVLIVDDEPPARAKLRRFLEPTGDFDVVAEADSVATAVAAVRAHAPALLYLDIQLGSENGFAVLEAIGGEFEPHVVFTTAYAEYAVRAFEVEALDYLLKPFDRERFMTSLARVREALAESDRGDLEERVRRLLAGQPGRPAPLEQIAIRERGRVLLLNVEDIEYVSAAGNYVEIFAHGRAHLLREPLTRFAAQLDAARFVRVHRSHLVRIAALAELHPLFSGDYELTLKSGVRLPMSRRYKGLLPAALRARL